MMTCLDVEQRLVALVTDTLPADVARAVEAHAAGCPACAATIAAERRVEAQLRSALRVEVPADLVATLQAGLPRAPRRWPGLVAALAAGLVVGLVWPRAAPTPAGWQVVAGEAQRTISAGERVAAGASGLVLATAEASIRLGPHASLTVGPRLRLHAGEVVVTAAGPLVLETPAGEISNDGGTFRAALGPDAWSEPMRPALSHLVAMAATAAVTVLLVRALDGDATVQTGAGSARVPAGAVAVATAEGPVRIPAAEDAALRGRLAQRDETIAELRSRIRELERAARTGDVAPRAPADVQAAVRALAREMGINAYGFLTPDTALMKEIAALGPEGVKLLSELLRTGNDDERFVAAAMLEKLGDPAAIPALADALFDQNSDNTLLQRISSHAIAVIGGEEAIAPLERVLEGDGEWGIKANSAYGLANMGREAGIDWLRETYQNTDDAMAKAALLPAMAEVGDPSYLPILHKLLAEETEYSKRFVALHGVSKIGSAESLPFLQALIDDATADRALVTAARKAFNEISGDDRYPEP